MPSTTWRILGASVTGASHLQAGKSCDDAHGYDYCDDRLLLLTVADGAGSASLASTGSSTAIKATHAAARRILLQQIEPDQDEVWQHILFQVLQASRSALEELVQDEPISEAEEPERGSQESPTVALRELATTLLLAIITPQWLAVAQIGDGAIIIQRGDGTIESLTSPDDHEYLNETTFLTDNNYLQQATCIVLPRTDINGIALLTDGLQMISMNYPANTPHIPFFTRMFEFASRPNSTEEELKTFLNSERVCSYTDDDKTLVLAVYR